jgi:hypothetical protein
MRDFTEFLVFIFICALVIVECDSCSDSRDFIREIAGHHD